MKKYNIAIILALIAAVIYAQKQPLDFIAVNAQNTGSTLQQAYQQRLSDIQVEDEGVVIKLLPDDLKGSRHQRFILKLAQGQTVLIAHNIDLADRIAGLKKGDRVEFNGEYEWNSRGGVIHWTHHDPAGRHSDGWLKHQGKTYQ